MKEYLFGSSRRIPGYGMIAKSTSATPEEERWVCEHSVYQRVGSKDESPVSYAFSRVQEQAFLSRTYATTDYTGRPSYIANHLQLNPDEVQLFEDGPVYLLTQYHFTSGGDENCTALDKNTTQYLGRFDLRKGENSACPTWRRFFKDLEPPMAARVADALGNRHPVSIVYEKEQAEWILALFGELYALLPATWRWWIPFNTYLSGPGSDAMLCGVLKDSSLYSTVRRNESMFYIDLSTGESHLPQVSSAFTSYFTTGATACPTCDSAWVAPENGESIYSLFNDKDRARRQLQDDCDAENQEIARQLKDLRQQRDTLNALMNEVRAKSQRWEGEKKRLEDEEANANKRVGDLNAQIESLAKRITELQGQKGQLEGNVASLETTKTNLVNECGRQKKQLDELRIEIQSEAQNLEKIQKNRNEANEALNNVNLEVKQCQQDKDNLQADIGRYQMMKDNLRKSIQYIINTCSPQVKPLQKALEEPKVATPPEAPDANEKGTSKGWGFGKK